MIKTRPKIENTYNSCLSLTDPDEADNLKALAWHVCKPFQYVILILLLLISSMFIKSIPDCNGTYNVLAI